MIWMTYDSPLGTLLLTCEAEGLTGIYMGKPLPEGKPEDHPMLLATAKWLDGYFAGNPLPIDIPLAPKVYPSFWTTCVRLNSKS